MKKTLDDLRTYSDPAGYLAEEGRIRVYGYSRPPLQPMTEPKTAGCYPVEMELTPGRYSWCSCGHSKMQPFCDNTHREPASCTNRKSYKFDVLETCTVKLCMCKRTKSPPFCDGCHEHCEV